MDKWIDERMINGWGFMFKPVSCRENYIWRLRRLYLWMVWEACALLGNGFDMFEDLIGQVREILCRHDFHPFPLEYHYIPSGKLT